MDSDRLLDRLLSLAPLAALGYVLHRHDAERRDLFRQLADDRESFRNERRELINRVQFPQRMPVATIPTRPADRAVSPTEEARKAYAQVGVAAAPLFGLPGDRDDLPGNDAE